VELGDTGAAGNLRILEGFVVVVFKILIMT
jgi:hypothetical protein